MEFPGAAENNEWKTWDEVPLGVGRTGDERPPPIRPQIRKKCKMKGKDKYTPKKRRETADEMESEPEPGAEVSGFKLDQVTARRERGGTAYYQTKSRERGDEFGEVLIIPPAFHPVPPTERDIEEGTPLPSSTENPLDQKENEVVQRRNGKAERRRTTELYRLDPPDEFQLPPRRVVVPSNQMEKTDPIVPVTDPEMEDLPSTPKYPQDVPSTPPNPSSEEARSISRAGQDHTMQIRSRGVEEQQASWSNIGAVLESVPWRNKTNLV